jgi:hypothetical protein
MRFGVSRLLTMERLRSDTRRWRAALVAHDETQSAADNDAIQAGEAGEASD